LWALLLLPVKGAGKDCSGISLVGGFRAREGTKGRGISFCGHLVQTVAEVSWEGFPLSTCFTGYRFFFYQQQNFTVEPEAARSWFVE
jgi:hypothetical protein